MQKILKLNSALHNINIKCCLEICKGTDYLQLGGNTEEKFNY